MSDVGGWNRAADAKVESNLDPPVEDAVAGAWGQTAEPKVKSTGKETVAPGDWGQAAAAIEGDSAGADPTQGGKAEVGQITAVFCGGLAYTHYHHDSVDQCNQKCANQRGQ